MARKTPPPAPPEPTKRNTKKPVATASPSPATPPRPKRNKPPAVPTTLPPPDPDAGLSPQQREQLQQLEDPGLVSIAERRARVARYRARKLTIREIAAAIGVGTTTVYRDMVALDELWLAEGETDWKRLRARELAELQDMERQIATALASSQNEDAKIRWQGTRLQVKSRIAALMGLNAPKAITGQIEVNDSGLSAQERRALAAYIAAPHAAAQPEDADGDE